MKAAAAVVVAGTALAAATPASARVVCDDWGRCWHTGPYYHHYYRPYGYYDPYYGGYYYGPEPGVSFGFSFGGGHHHHR
jgi:hypothetical protein